MKDKNALLQETIVQITASIYPQVYEKCECFTEASAEIIRLAKKFEDELNWQDDDERDYLDELDKFCNKYLEEISYVKQEQSIYDCYEEIKQREIRELKEKLKAFGGVAHFGPDYMGEGATGVDMPYICVHFDEGPLDVRVHAVSICQGGILEVLGSIETDNCPRTIKLDDIAYGHIEYITEAIPVRKFSKDKFKISALSREDLESIGFDASDVDDDTMERLADKLGEDYCEQLFWTSLEIIAEEGFNIPRKESKEDEEG